jgi:hypothetical protein
MSLTLNRLMLKYHSRSIDSRSITHAQSLTLNRLTLN